MSVSMTEYETVSLNLARAVGLQKDLKKRRYKIGVELSNRYMRLNRNGLRIDGKDLVPRMPAMDIVSLTLKLGKLERQILVNRKKIQELTMRLVTMRVHRMLSKAIDKAFKAPPATPRDVVKKIFSLQGLFLHDNNEVSGAGGKLVGIYGDDAKMIHDELSYSFKPVQAIEFIELDIKIDDMYEADGNTLKPGVEDWSWSRNWDCKYINLRFDMRDGGFVLTNNKGERICLEQLKWQYQSLPKDGSNGKDNL